MSLDDEHQIDPVPPPEGDRDAYDALPIEPGDPLAIERLLDVPEAERRKRNHGFDPLETLPPEYRSEGMLPAERPDDKTVLEEDDRYLDTFTFHHRVDGDLQPVHHYVIQEVYRKERTGELRMRPLEYCSEAYLAISEDIQHVL